MTERFRQGLRNFGNQVSASLQDKFKTDSDKRNPDLVKIRLHSDSEKLLHSYPIRCEGYPTEGNVKGEFKWYRVSTNTKEKTPENDNFQLVSTTTIPVFHPNIEDSTSEIACQWIPDKAHESLYQESNFAHVGPLVIDPTILTDAQTMVDTNAAHFRVEIADPSASGDQNFKQLKVDCKYAIITIMEETKDKVGESERDKEEMDDGSSHHSPSLSSVTSTGTNVTNRSNRLQPPSPRSSHISNASLDGHYDSNDHDHDHNHEETHAMDEITLDHHDTEKMKTIVISNIDHKPIAHKDTMIKIRNDFQIQMSRSNTQQMTIVRNSQSNKATVTMVDLILQSVRERDVLYAVLNAIITKKKQLKDEKEQLPDIVRVEIYPIDGTDKHLDVPSASEQKKLKQSLQQINQLNTENTQMMEEKKQWKKEKENLQAVIKVQSEQLKQLTKEKKESTQEHQKTIKERDSIKDSWNEEKKTSARLGKTIEELNSEMKSLKSENEDMNKKMKEKDTQIRQLQQEAVDMAEDRLQLQNTLKSLNEHVGNATETKTKMDQDLMRLNNEKLQLKEESRQWQSRHERLEKEVKELLDYEQKKRRDLNEKYNDLMKAHKDIKYEIARREEECQRFKADIEQLQQHILVDSKEKESKNQQILTITDKVESLTSKNESLQQQVLHLENQLKGSVSRQDWELLQNESSNVQKKLDTITLEKDAISNEMKILQSDKSKLMTDIESLNKKIAETEEEVRKLETYHNFWKTRANSTRRELLKVLAQLKQTSDSKGGINGHLPHVQKQLEKKKELEKEVKKLKDEKKSAETVVKTYRQAFENEISKRKKALFRHSLFKSRVKETAKESIKKNQQLHRLANELADTVIDREESIKHLKEVKKFLATRVKQVEEENNVLRKKLGMPPLEPQGKRYLQGWNRRSPEKNQTSSSFRSEVVRSSHKIISPPNDELEKEEEDETEDEVQEEVEEEDEEEEEEEMEVDEKQNDKS